MKKSTLLLLALSATGSAFSATADAAANSTSVLFTIGNLDTGFAAYEIRPVPTLTNNATNDPNNCIAGTTPIDKFIVVAGASAADRELMTRTLLGAFLAGRKVALGISGTECVNGKPAYYSVTLNKDN